MSEAAINARAKAREKVERLTRTPKGDVDASGWREPLMEQGRQSGVQTGPRPVSPRQFRRGGKVDGFAAMKHAGRKPRASGGMTANDYQNRDLKSANESREGPKHLGGMKKGGRAHKFVGGPNMGGRPMPMRGGAPVVRPGLAQPMGRQFARGGHVEGCTCAKCSGGAVRRPRATGGPVSYGGSRPMGGRIARASGGRSKKGTNINIIIAPPNPKPAMPPPAMMPPGGPPGMHQGAPPMPPPGAPPPMGPAGGAPPLMRAYGGRTDRYPIKDGAGGGKGRLQKIAAYG